MTELFLQFGISNLLLSLVLAVLAYAVHRAGKFPALAHLLWVLVLVKLVTPPVISLPLVPVPGMEQPSPRIAAELSTLDMTIANGLSGGAVEEFGSGELSAAKEPVVPTNYGLIARNVLLIGWLIGSVWVLSWSLWRVFRFNRLLNRASNSAPPGIQHQAAALARRLGLKSAPHVYATAAQLSPMVWWVGTQVKVILPAQLLDELDADNLQWVLAHELAHVRRRDYLVRWLEWLACVACWWNPVTWIARRHLRANEEICCDALVLSSLRPKPKTYASALMAVVEFLASPVIRPPAVASELNSGGFLERRFRMIMSKDRQGKTPRWLVAGLLLATFGLMPLGVAYGQDFDAIQKRLGKAVGRGEITLGQANAMMAALKKSSAPKNQVDYTSSSAAHYEAVSQKLKAAVAAGELSKAEAAEKWNAVNEEKAIVLKKIKAAAANDEATQAKAVRLWAEILKKQSVQGQAAAAAAAKSSEVVAQKLKAAIASGGLTQAEALQKWARLSEEAARSKVQAAAAEEALKAAKAKEAARKKAAGSQRQDQGQDQQATLEGLKRRLALAVEAGTISKEQAQSRLEAYTVELKLAGSKDRGKDRGEVSSEETVALAIAKLREAAATGTISKQQAEAKLVELKKSLAARSDQGATSQGADNGGIDWANIKKRVEGAVNSGDMTREQADELYLQIKKQIDRGR